jgi:hypothetical protein
MKYDHKVALESKHPSASASSSIITITTTFAQSKQLSNHGNRLEGTTLFDDIPQVFLFHPIHHHRFIFPWASVSVSYMSYIQRDWKGYSLALLQKIWRYTLCDLGTTKWRTHWRCATRFPSPLLLLRMPSAIPGSSAGRKKC